MIEDWLYWILVSDPRTALWFGFRVSPVFLDQEAVPKTEAGDPLPFATYRMVSSESEETLDLANNGETAVVEVVAFAPSYPEAKAAAKAVKAAIARATESGFGCSLRLVLKSGEQDDAAVPVNGKEAAMYAVEMQFTAHYQE